jgi:hypothetical protein
MIRKLVVISSLLLITIAGGALVWTRSAQGLVVSNSDEVQAIKETIFRARRLRIDAEYNFDTNKFASVYINDPRGGEIPAEALDLIREIRQDPTIRADTVGILDYEKVAIENLKRSYENYIAVLRTKEASGTLTEEERLILKGETNDSPTLQPDDEGAAAIATQTCEQFLAKTTLQLPQAGLEAAYPEPKPESQRVACPTSTPKPEIWVHHRGSNPLTLPAEALDININSIEIDGEVAKAVVQEGPVTSEYVLVKADGQWYIAGARLLKFDP